MEMRLVHFYTNGVIVLTFAEKANGLMVVLVDDKNASVARYEFCSDKLKTIDKIIYQANKARIHFEDITPTGISEIDSVSE